MITASSERSKMNFNLVSSILWVIFNIAGMLFIYTEEYWGLPDLLFDTKSFFSMTLVLIFSFLLDSLIFTLCQLIYLIIFSRGEWIYFWAFRTWIAVFLVQVIEEIGVYLLAPFFFEKLSGFGYLLYPLLGIRIFTFDSLLIEIITASVVGVVFGLLTGGILGLFQASAIKRKKLALDWFLSVTVSLLLAFTVNSILFSMTKYGYKNIFDPRVLYTSVIITGLLYGLATLKPMEKLLLRLNKNSETIHSPDVDS